LTGAHGILVNVTATEESLEISEFQLVNELIAEMGAEDVEVIVGTAFDPAMGDELRVTGVATGLGYPQTGSESSVVRHLHRDSNGQPRDEELDKPTVLRRQQPRRAAQSEFEDMDMDYLDVPAFLRNQAD